MKTISNLGEAVEGGRNNFHLIRLIAAILVIYGHSYAISGNPGPDLIQQALRIRFAGSFAVDAFFVISGFLITASLEKHTLYQYSWARFLRIFPALLVCVALTVFVLGPLLTIDPGYWKDSQTWAYLKKTSTLSGGISILPGVFTDAPRPSVNGSLWTLNIEIRLYIVSFFLALFGLVKGNRYSLLIIASFMVGFFYIPDIWPINFLFASKRWLYSIALFFAGAFVWKNRYALPLSYPLLGLMIGLASIFRGTPQFEIAYFFVLIYFVMFIAYVPHLPVIKRRDLSYGVYLYGWPVQQVVEHLRPNSTAMFNASWSIAASLCIAYLSWELIEKRALTLKKHMVSPMIDLRRLYGLFRKRRKDVSESRDATL